MGAASRIGDRTKGHKAHPPRVVAKGSTRVLVTGRPAARLGDIVQPNPSPPPKTHPGIIAKGNKRVLVGGRPLSRKGDRVVCREKIAKGAATVRA